MQTTIYIYSYSVDSFNPFKWQKSRGVIWYNSQGRNVLKKWITVRKTDFFIIAPAKMFMPILLHILQMTF